MFADFGPSFSGGYFSHWHRYRATQQRIQTKNKLAHSRTNFKQRGATLLKTRKQALARPHQTAETCDGHAVGPTTARRAAGSAPHDSGNVVRAERERQSCCHYASQSSQILRLPYMAQTHPSQPLRPPLRTNSKNGFERARRNAARRPEFSQKRKTS